MTCLWNEATVCIHCACAYTMQYEESSKLIYWITHQLETKSCNDYTGGSSSNLEVLSTPPHTSAKRKNWGGQSESWGVIPPTRPLANRNLDNDTKWVSYALIYGLARPHAKDAHAERSVRSIFLPRGWQLWNWLTCFMYSIPWFLFHSTAESACSPPHIMVFLNSSVEMGVMLWAKVMCRVKLI